MSEQMFSEAEILDVAISVRDRPLENNLLACEVLTYAAQLVKENAEWARDDVDPALKARIDAALRCCVVCSQRS